MNQELEKGSRILDLIDFQENSVVSKTIIDKSSGSVTLFAFEKDQGLSEHTAPYDALVQILEGKAEIIIGGKQIILNEGEIVIMPANIPHSLKSVQSFKMLLTMIRG